MALQKFKNREWQRNRNRNDAYLNLNLLKILLTSEYHYYLKNI